MQRKKHRKWKKKNLNDKLSFAKISEERPAWANDDKMVEEDTKWKENLINEVKQIHKQNKEQEIQMKNGNNEMSQSMLAGLAGLAAYDQMKNFIPQKNENAKVIELDKKSQVVADESEKEASRSKG